MNSLRRLFFILSILFGLVTIIVSFIDFEDINKDYIIRGRFDKELVKINDLHFLGEYIDKQLLQRNIHYNDTTLIVMITDSVLQERFYHGTARYNIDDNWLAYCAGVILWDDLRMIVIPDHLLKKKVVACNQMTIIFHALLKKKKLTHRAVGLNQHMVSEVRYGGDWHMYDPDYEPVLITEMSVDNMLNNTKAFRETYIKTQGAQFNKNFNAILDTNTARYYPQNISLANNLRVFHYISSFFSNVGWLFFALLGFIFHFYKPCAE